MRSLTYQQTRLLGDLKAVTRARIWQRLWNRGMRRMRRVALYLCLSLTLVTPAACTTGSDSGGVDWENYAASVKQRIDSLAAAGDCDGLQSEFDTAEANSDSQRARTGDGNADLMDYIDGELSGAGCYD